MEFASRHTSGTSTFEVLVDYWKLRLSIGQPVSKNTKFKKSLDFDRPNNNNGVLQHSLHDPNSRCVCVCVCVCVSDSGQSKQTGILHQREDLPVNTTEEHLGQTNSPSSVS